MDKAQTPFWTFIKAESSHGMFKCNSPNGRDIRLPYCQTIVTEVIHVAATSKLTACVEGPWNTAFYVYNVLSERLAWDIVNRKFQMKSKGYVSLILHKRSLCRDSGAPIIILLCARDRAPDSYYNNCTMSYMLVFSCHVTCAYTVGPGIPRIAA